MENFSSYIKTKAKNKRVITTLLLVISFLSLMGPFAKLSISSSLTVPFTNNSIKSDTYNVGTLNLGSFTTFSNVGDIKVGNRPINQYQIFGINIYQSLKTPPNFSDQLDQAVNKLDPSMLEMMSSEDFRTQLLDLSPQFGQQIFDVSKAVGQSLTVVREVVISTKPIVEEVDKSLEQTANAIRVAELYKTIANIFIFTLFALTFIAVVLMCFVKVPLIIPRLLIAFSFITVAILVFAVPVVANQINATVTHITTQLNANINTQVTTIINNLFGDKGKFITFIIGNNTNYIHFNAMLSLGWAPILTLITMLSAFIMSFFIVEGAPVPVTSSEVDEPLDVETKEVEKEAVNEERIKE